MAEEENPIIREGLQFMALKTINDGGLLAISALRENVCQIQEVLGDKHMKISEFVGLIDLFKSEFERLGQEDK